MSNDFKPSVRNTTSCEKGVSVDHFQPVEELLALIASFTMLGKAELKVALCVTNPQPPGFRFDPPLSKGISAFYSNILNTSRIFTVQLV